MRKVFNNLCSGLIWCAHALRTAFMYVFGEISDPSFGTDASQRKRLAIRGGVIAFVYFQFSVEIPSLILQQYGANFGESFLFSLLVLTLITAQRGRLPGITRTVDWSTGVGLVTYRFRPLQLLYRQLIAMTVLCVTMLSLGIMFTSYRPPIGQSPGEMLVDMQPYISSLLPLIIVTLLIWRVLRWMITEMRSQAFSQYVADN